MYDTLTTSYTFACPVHGRRACGSRASAGSRSCPARSIPRVYRVEFDCGCGAAHPGLVTHDELDWAPLGLHDADAVPEPDDLAHGGDVERARRARRDAHQGGGVAVELLLLAGGAAAARCTRRRSCCSRRRRRAIASASPCAARSAGRSRSTSSRARTSTCRSSTTARWGWWSICFAEDAAATVERVPRRALVGLLRRPAPRT